jgi:hypothetical protein
MTINCVLCKCEIGQLVPGASGIVVPAIRDSKSGTTFYLTPAAFATRGVCRDCREGKGGPGQ